MADPDRWARTDAPYPAAAALLPGTKIGAYVIEARLGVGGMGEVYRARDTKLGRDVAIKVLPAAFMLDPERLTRFEREARLLAALNHPNIAAIYGFDETTGIRALVLELVEGESLAERLRSGPLSITEALRIARQTTDALDAAHEKGIVHRDLKPANLTLTPNGDVKVIDFGIGTVAAGEGTRDLSEPPTVTAGATREGTLLGTVRYMSPEQARGRAVDKRTDIWAFGCVLYEMLTGSAAFAGETVSDSIATILGGDPDWTVLPRGTPPTIQRLLRRCLEKDPRQRLRDIADARSELDDPDVGAAAWTRSTSRRIHWPASAAIGIVIALAAIAVWRTLVAGTRQPPLASGPLIQLTSDSGFTTAPSISVDGRLVAYASDRSGDGNLDIWVQQTAGGPPIRLTNDPTDNTDPDVSPDGSVVAFRSDRNGGGIYVVPAFGGDARLIALRGRAPKFSPDGRSIAFWTGGWLAPRALDVVRRTFVVPTSGGEPVQVAKSLPSAGDPVWSPDGRALLVWAHATLRGSDPTTDWWWVPLDGGTPIPSGAYERIRAAGILTTPNSFPYPASWTERGVFFAGQRPGSPAQNLWAISIDQQTGKATGVPWQITSGPSRDASPAVARDGRIVFAGETQRDVILGVPLDANAGRTTGTASPLRNDAAATGRASASRDGRLLVFPVFGFGDSAIWLRDLRSGRERQLSLASPGSLNPVISADGKWVAYTATTVELGAASGPGSGYVIDTAGGSPKKVCDRCEVYGWLADDRQVIVRPDARTSVDVIDIKTGLRATALSATAVIERPLLSPDERWIAFNADQRIFLAPFRPGQPPPQSAWVEVAGVTAEGLRAGERTCGWSPDGRLLYVLLQRDGFRCLYAIRIDDTSGRPVGDPFPVHHFHEAKRQWGSTGYGSAVVTGLFVSDLFEYGGNIWMTNVNHF